jgi:hypothetical protein
MGPERSILEQVIRSSKACCCCCGNFLMFCCRRCMATCFVLVMTFVLAVGFQYDGSETKLI